MTPARFTGYNHRHIARQAALFSASGRVRPLWPSAPTKCRQHNRQFQG
ncbi:MAG: hypothetical protein SPL53_07980 [Bacteroidales bacterium]|nr:hypothetical protein [Bacteroidales bacterium]